MNESENATCTQLSTSVQGKPDGPITLEETGQNESCYIPSPHYEEELPWLASKQNLPTPPPTTASNAEWNRREAELAERERVLRQQGHNQSRAANFPSFYPLLRHDIQADIPLQAKRAVSFSYASCKALLLTLLVIVGSETTWYFSKLVPVNSLALSFLYLFLVPPFVFVFSHLRLYRATLQHSILNFAGYFAATFVTNAFYILLGIGVWTGIGHGGGILGVIEAISVGKIAAAVTACVSCAMLFATLVMNLYTATLAFKYCRQSPAGGFAPPNEESIRRSVVVERHAQV